MGAQPSVTELIEDAARLDAGEFDHFFSKVLTLRAQRNAPVLAKEESDLLKKINRGFPENKWQRLDMLNEKVEEGVLTKAEQAELGILIEAYEKYTARRIQHLGQLANTRRVTLQELMKQLGIWPEHYG